ncbi:hypothetical protein [Nocardia brasiliensis]|uniref:hypothetical protein n=1 Tax=Nocardia brasiliensis TaxID=37326 RepID=UPI0024542B57|nr:hypothetical protein [Nocardia brasiliensis]
MSMSVSVDIFWGYDLGEMVDDDWESTAPQWWQDAEDSEDGVEWEEEYARRHGWVEEPFPADYPDTSAEWQLSYEERNRIQVEFEAGSVQYQAWSASRDRLRELVRQCPVELDTYGHVDGETGWVVRVKASVQPHYGCTASLLALHDPDPAWAAEIAQFMTLLELPVPAGKPGWHIASSYG